MAMFENFPYTDMHNLNLDWIIKIAKDFLDQYTHIQQLISDGETSLQNLTTEGLQQLQEKAENLESLLQAWYDSHSQDIANQLADALADLNEWYTVHQNYLDATLQANITAFDAHADQKAQQTIASIPDDYTTLSNDVVYIKNALIKMGYQNFLDVNDISNGYVTNGNVVPDGDTYPYRHTDYIPVSYGDIIYFASSNGQSLCAFEGYTSEHEFVKDYLRTTPGTGPASIVIDKRNVKYIRYNLMPVYVTPISDQYLIIQHGIDYLWINDTLYTDIKDLYSNDFIAGYIVDIDGIIKTSQYVTEWAVTELIEIPNKCYVYWAIGQRKYGEQIPAIYIYDENQNPIEAYWSPENNSAGYCLINNPNAKYLRYNIFPNATFNRNNQYLRYAVPFNIENTININNILQSTNYRITVSKDGTGDYIKLADAIKFAYERGNVDIYVKAGTYDIIDELNISSDADCPGYGEGNNTNWGLKIGKNVRIFGENNTKLTAFYSGSSTDFASRFSILNVTGNYELHNLNFEGQNIRYCIHEDIPALTAAYAEGMNGYTSLIENCNMKHNGGYSTPACMGCGDTDNSLTIIKGGSYESHNYNYPISMHNHAGTSSGKIIVENVYFKNGTLRLAGFNTTQTGQILEAIAIGNNVEADIFIDLDSSFVSLIKWNNNIRN